MVGSSSVVVRVFALLSMSGLGACGVTQVLDHDGEGRPILIRTPQPDAEDLREFHEEYGIKTVLNLRGEDTDRPWFVEEKEGVEAIGAQWLHMRLSGRSAPDPEEVERFFDIVEDASNWPILMHCAGGIHRTGALSALYRIQYQGWDSERAVEEMEDNYYNWTVKDREELKEYVRQYRRREDRSLDRRVSQ